MDEWGAVCSPASGTIDYGSAVGAQPQPGRRRPAVHWLACLAVAADGTDARGGGAIPMPKQPQKRPRTGRSVLPIPADCLDGAGNS